MNNLIIKLLALINKRRHGLSRMDYFHVGLISDNLNLPVYIINTDTINIKIITDKYIENFSNYDLIVIIKENENYNFQIQPLSYFYTPEYFSLDNSLKVAYITCNKFYIPEEIIYDKNYIYPIEQSINILKGEN